MKKKFLVFVLIAMILTLSALPVSASEQVDVIPTDATIGTTEAIIDEISTLDDTAEASTFEKPFIPDATANEGNPVEFVGEAEVTLPSIGISTLSMEVDTPPEVIEDTVSDVKMISSLKEIVGSGKYALSNNITNEFVTINADWDVTFDFNGYTISVNTSRPFTNSGNLTLIATNGGGVNNAAGTGFGTVTNNAGAVVTIESGTYTSDFNGSTIRNTGTAIINGGTFNDVRAVANMGTTIINGGTFNQFPGTTAYILHNEGTSMTINNATVNGAHGAVAHHKGYLEINNGTFNADAFYGIFFGKSFAGPYTANINGGTFTSGSQVGIYIAADSNDASDSIKINGGLFSGKKGAANIVDSAEDGSATVTIAGGTFIGTDINKYVPADKEQNLADVAPEWTVVARTYKVSIENGNLTTDSDKFAPGELVSIVANMPTAKMVFDKWVSDDIELANESTPNLTFEMPEKEVTIRATYKDAPTTVIPPKNNFETVYSDIKGPITATIEKPEGTFQYITIKIKNAPQEMVSFFSAMGDSCTEIFVDPSNYTIGDDGSTITLHEDFILSLGGGEYVINAVFSGGIATLPLTISTENAPLSPDLEDDDSSQEDVEIEAEDDSSQESDDNNDDTKKENDSDENSSDEKKTIENKETEKHSTVAPQGKIQVTKTPQTGDETNLVVNAAIIIIGLLMIGGFSIKTKLKKSK